MGEVGIAGVGSRKIGARFLVSASILALGVMGAAPAFAQETPAPAPAPAEEEEAEAAPASEEAGTIIVTGVRRALQTARARKKNADTVMDSITATDIGAFPDKSVADALQRVPGITVTRFAISGDVAHFTTEPSGVLVRGLPQVRNEFNGRDTFSATGGRALSWGDVPAELLGGVDIYKNQTAELIEGGIAGSVNLRTRVPFDSTGQLIQLGIKENWGDIAKKFTPDASAFYSNRWNTGIGEIGLMGHVAYSRVRTGSQGLQSYRAGVFTCAEGEAPSASNCIFPGQENIDGPLGPGVVVIPTSLNFLDDRFDRKRTGIAAAAQWRSNDQKWLATAQFIRSNYKNSMEEQGFGVGMFGFDDGGNPAFRFRPGTGGIPRPAAGTPDFTFGSDGFMDSGVFTQTGGWWGAPWDEAGMSRNEAGEPMIHSCYSWFGYPDGYCPAGFDVHAPTVGTNTRIQDGKSMTQEASLNLKYQATDNLRLNFDGQYVDSKTEFYDAAIALQSFANPELTGLGSQPRLVSLQPPANVFQSPGGLSNANNWFINNLADNYQNSKGTELALRADAEWEVPNGGWEGIDTVRFGARWSDRDQLVRNSDYNWNSISNTWTNGCQYLYFNLDAQPGTCSSDPSVVFNGYPANFYQFQDFGAKFFGGNLGNYPFVPVSFLKEQGLDPFSRENLGIGTFVKICDRAGQPGTFAAPELEGSCFAPHEIADISEETRAIYVMAKFGGNDDIQVGGVKISGNFGLRYIQTIDKSSGFEVFPTITVNPEDVCPATPLVPGGLTGDATPPPVPVPGEVPFHPICWLSPADVQFAGGPGSAQPVSDTNKLNHVLPSLNLRFDFSPSWLLRFAVSRAMSRPDMGLLKNYLRVSQNLAPTNNPSDPRWIKDGQGNIIGLTPTYTGSATSPMLKPITAWQFDLSLEHYFGNAGLFSLALFHKSFQNYIQGGSFFEELENNGVTRIVQVSRPANGKGAKIHGFEVAYNRFFDFLPKPLDGLGVQTNFTYVKNKGVPNSNLVTFFPVPGGVVVPSLEPGSIEGLSKYSYNLVGLYEKPNFPFSLRLAYNWRSKYLITARDCCVNLPVWQKATGWLDGSIRYSVNKNLEMSIEGSNLLNTKTVTLQQLSDENSPEGKVVLMQNSWFRQDRRFTFGVRWKMGN